jgi:hypothetical protein
MKRNDVIVGSMLRPRQNGEFSAERAGIKNSAANGWSHPFEVHWRSQSEGEFDGGSCSTSSDAETQLEVLAFLPVVANPKRLISIQTSAAESSVWGTRLKAGTCQLWQSERFNW